MRTVNCDICGEEIKGQTSYGLTKITGNLLDRATFDMDICDKCVKTLMKIRKTCKKKEK